MKQLADFTTHLFVTKGIVTEADAPIYAYGFEVLFSSLFTFGSIFVLAACFDFFVETLVFFAAFFPLRIYAGGYHASTNVYSNIVTSNNVFPDNPKVISDANNPGTVLIRVKSSTGEIIGNVKRVAPGQSVTLDTIPAMSGTYVIQGQAGVSGNYYFHIT